MALRFPRNAIKSRTGAQDLRVRFRRAHEIMRGPTMSGFSGAWRVIRDELNF